MAMQRSSSALAINPIDLAEQRVFYLLARPNPPCNVVNVRTAEAQFLGDTRKGSLRSDQLPELLVPRVIVTRDIVTSHRQGLYATYRPRSRGILATTGASLEKHEWARQISELRKSLNLTQAGFGKELGVSQVTVSRWESGADRPTSLNFLRMAQLTENPEFNRLFYNLSNIDAVLQDRDGSPLLIQAKFANATEVRVEVIPAKGSMKPGGGLKRNPDAVAVPLLKDSAAAGNPRLINEAAVEDTLLLRRKTCPHPEDTLAIKITGDSMSPILEDGYVVAIDTADRDPKKLLNRMVAARDPEGGVTIKWLRKVGNDVMLIAQHTSPRYNPIFLNREPGWAIIGKVLFWIGRPS